jgi:hypothetical protein
MKPRSDSRLFKLSDEQQAQLYDWIHKLGYVKARELAGLPPPEGFGLKTHLNSLCRFVARYSEIQKEREFFDILRCASGELDPRVVRAAQNAAHHIAFEIATSPFSLESFRELSRWIGKLKDEEYRAARLKVEADQFALDRDRLAHASGLHAGHRVTLHPHLRDSTSRSVPGDSANRTETATS